ncbi:MAG TPA: phosphatase [Clostridiaceae bacterium]|nr:phosphatase [Clostridiaceae bacterium]
MITSVKTDMHTHTIASGHAYSTILDNVAAAKNMGLEAIAITEHGPTMPGSVHQIYFHNFSVVPRKIDGIYVFCGVELNVLDYQGNVDLSNNLLSRLDFVIASIHGNILDSGTMQNHTEAWLGVINNPYIDCLGHPGRGDFEFDLSEVLTACKRNNVAIEVNVKSLEKHINRPRCEDIILGCKAFEVPILVNSDAHFSFDIGQFKLSIDLLNSLNFPEELVINRDIKSLLPWLAKRKPWKSDIQDLAKQFAD